MTPCDRGVRSVVKAGWDRGRKTGRPGYQRGSRAGSRVAKFATGGAEDPRSQARSHERFAKGIRNAWKRVGRNRKYQLKWKSLRRVRGVRVGTGGRGRGPIGGLADRNQQRMHAPPTKSWEGVLTTFYSLKNREKTLNWGGAQGARCGQGSGPVVANGMGMGNIVGLVGGGGQEKE